MLATVIVVLAAVTAPLQDSVVPPRDTAPLQPTAEQTHYLEGLRTVARGVAQLRDGIDRVARTQQGRDNRAPETSWSSTRRPMYDGAHLHDERPAPHGRYRLRGLDAHRRAQLVVRIDSIVKFLPTCSTTAGRQPASVAADLLNRMRAYETALAAFRAVLVVPRPDSMKTPTQR